MKIGEDPDGDGKNRDDKINQKNICTSPIIAMSAQTHTAAVTIPQEVQEELGQQHLPQSVQLQRLRAAVRDNNVELVSEMLPSSGHIMRSSQRQQLYDIAFQNLNSTMFYMLRDTFSGGSGSSRRTSTPLS